MGGRRAGWLLGTLAAAALVLGCGGGDDEEATADDGAETTAVATTSEAPSDEEETTTTSTTTTTTEAPTTTAATTGTTPWPGLSAGECVADLPTGTFTVVELAPCDGPHDAEVFHTERIFPDPLRGSSIEDQAGGACEAAFPGYAGRALEGSGLVVSSLVAAPSEPSTPGLPSTPALPDINDSLVICLVEDASDAPLTGSVAG